MGGHGGLNILPQKSWNVYNIKNQNIVRRDEEQFRQQQAESERQTHRDQAEARLSKLREGRAPSIQRFNLFEEEEKNANEYEKKRRQAENEKREKDKDTWYLGKARPINPWYERPTQLDDKGPEIRRRSEIDPMNLVNSLLSKPEETIEKHHKHKSSRKTHKKHNDSTKERSGANHGATKKDRRLKDRNQSRRRSRSPSSGDERKSSKKRHRKDV